MKRSKCRRTGPKLCQRANVRISMGDLPMLRPVTQRAAVRVRCGLLHHRVYPFDMEGVPRFILSDRYNLQFG